MQTLGEIRTNLSKTTRETQINDLINEFINITLMEINDPAWATKGYQHNWTFNKRKDTFATVASQEFYQLPRDLDRISLIRQTDSPTKLKYYPDNIFYRRIPDPTATGNPIYYRLWEEEGLEVRLTTNDTFTVVSSSTSDGSSVKLSISGTDANGIKQTEVFTLNGTTPVIGTITFATGKPIRASKSAKTIGDITITETTGATTAVILGRDERSPKFKVIGLYPLPASAITMYLEYYTRIRRLENDSDVPDLDSKWIWVVRLGALTKIYQHQEPDAKRTLSTQSLFKQAVIGMVKADILNLDYIPTLSKNGKRITGIAELSDDQFSVNYL